MTRRDLEPWVRQPGESSRAWHAFCHYRDLGVSRSINRAWRTHKTICDHVAVDPRHRAPKRWQVRAFDWHWVGRAEAWDADVDRQTREKLAQQQLEARERHLRLAQASLSSLSSPVSAVLHALQDPRVQPALTRRIASSPEALLAAVQIVARCAQVIPGIVSMERLALGLTTDLLTIDAPPRDDVSAKIAADPEATELAIQLLHRLGQDGARLVH